MQVIYTPSIDQAGKVTRVIAVVFDVTERRRLEEQLRHAQKMEAIGSLAGGIAHDFNNLLTVINGYTDMALSTLDASHPARHDLFEVRRAGDRAAALIRQLLAFSRKQALHPRVVDPAALIERMSTLLQRLVPGNVRLNTLIGPGVGTIEVDPGQLEQAVMNLVLNARDAMPAGGEINIELTSVDIARPGHDGPHELDPGLYVRLRVSDTGEGMDDATLGRIWEPFFTTKPPGQGTGLGLPMVYGFVSQSGGAIDVHTAPGEGATFDIYLPRARRAGAQAAAPSAAPGGTILLVEDDESVRAIAAQALREEGYAVIEAASAVEALAFDGKDVDLVLTDVVMPGSDGPKLVADLAARLGPVRVLFMSGHTRPEQQFVAPDGSPAPVLRKPFTRAGLIRAVREALEGT
ncbi:MAG: hypothetical protein Kow0010_19800 [Dehalococcoidia bacterium]